MKWIKKIFDRYKDPKEVPLDEHPDSETEQIQKELKLSDEAMAQLFPKEAVMITAVFEAETESDAGTTPRKAPPEAPSERKGWVDPLSGHPIV